MKIPLPPGVVDLAADPDSGVLPGDGLWARGSLRASVVLVEDRSLRGVVRRYRWAAWDVLGVELGGSGLRKGGVKNTRAGAVRLALGWISPLSGALPGA